MSTVPRHVANDPADVVARVSASRRERLLRVHRRRLRFEDLEDCYSQATLELLIRSRRSPFADEEHAVNALEQKFLSRITDRRRALAGRSGIEAALANAVPVDSPDDEHHELEDRRAGVERQVLVHTEVRRLREVIAELSVDQRLVLHAQINLGLDAETFCGRYAWSIEKFRKVAQRARWRLRALVDEYHSGERCRRLEPDLLALVAKAASEEQHLRARTHLANCSACARYVAELDRAGREVAAILPPFGMFGAIGVRMATYLVHLKRLLFAVRHPFSEAGSAGMAGLAGGSSVGLATVKAGALALCIAGAAGGYAICAHAHLPILFEAPAHVSHFHRRAASGGTEPRHIAIAPPVALATVVRPYRARPSRRALVSQIRREFGAHHAVAASVTSTRPARSTQPPATVEQEQTEFGFER